MTTTVFKPTKWLFDIGASLLKANLHLIGLDAPPKDAGVIFVANRATRLDVLMLAHALHSWGVQDLSLLVPDGLLRGRIGRFLRTNALAVQNVASPEMVAARGLLSGRVPCVIFPEKPVRALSERSLPQSAFVGEQRTEQVALPAPALDAAALALRAEFFRRRIASALPEELPALLDAAGIASSDASTAKQTLIIPVNVTYFPVRSREDIFRRYSRAVTKDPSRKTIEELPIDGTVLAAGVDINIAFGDPISVSDCLDQPELRAVADCAPEAFDESARDPDSALSKASGSLTQQVVDGLSKATAINPDHILAALVRFQWGTRFTEQAIRHRAFLVIERLAALGDSLRLGPAITRFRRELLHDDPSPLLRDFAERCIKERVLDRVGKRYWRLQPSPWLPSFLERKETLIDTIADEVDALLPFSRLIEEIASTPAFANRWKVRSALVQEDRQQFENEYARYYEAGGSKPIDVGRPFLMKPVLCRKGGIVLVHGYMAAPLEVRVMADYFRRKGYAVYAVRLRGHGTSPVDLGARHWEEWIASIAHGCAVMETVTDNVIVGGFSMGAGLSLLTAGLRKNRVAAVFAVDPPLLLRNAAARFAPSIVRMNRLLKRLRWGRVSWEYVENDPENKHINYFSNPVSGVAELNKAMHRAMELLPEITAPTLIVQGSKDPLVSFDSGPTAFEKIGTSNKILTILERNRHGIINGVGSEDVYEHIAHFLVWAHTKHRDSQAPAPE